MKESKEVDEVNFANKQNTYIVEWQEIVTYSEEVQAENEDQALMYSGAEPEIVDSDVVECSLHIERVQD
jgi:hypothetical protein